MKSWRAEASRKKANVAAAGKSLMNHIALMNYSNICCFHSFDCPNLIDRDNSKCYYKNQTLLPGEVLENFQQSDTCEAKCYCNLNRAGGPSEIFCSRLKCNDKRPAKQKTQKCLQQYENGNCCPVNAVCGKEKFLVHSAHFIVRNNFMRFYSLSQMMTSTS